MSFEGKLDIEIYNGWQDNGDKWEQAKYLVHGYDDVLWTDDLNSACEFLKDELKKFNP